MKFILIILSFLLLTHCPSKLKDKELDSNKELNSNKKLDSVKTKTLYTCNLANYRVDLKLKFKEDGSIAKQTCSVITTDKNEKETSIFSGKTIEDCEEYVDHENNSCVKFSINR